MWPNSACKQCQMQRLVETLCEENSFWCISLSHINVISKTISAAFRVFFYHSISISSTVIILGKNPIKNILVFHTLANLFTWYIFGTSFHVSYKSRVISWTGDEKDYLEKIFTFFRVKTLLHYIMIYWLKLIFCFELPHMSDKFY